MPFCENSDSCALFSLQYPECLADIDCGEYGCAKCNLTTLTCNLPSVKGTICPQIPTDQCDGFGNCVVGAEGGWHCGVPAWVWLTCS